MAIRTVVTRGYGNGTFNGTIPLVVTRGYAIGSAVVVPDASDFDSNEYPMIREGGTLTFKVDFTRDLDEGDTVSEVSIAETESSDLTIGTPTIGTTSTRIGQRTALPGMWAKATLSGHLAATGVYRLKATFSTAGGVVDKSPPEDYVFEVAE